MFAQFGGNIGVNKDFNSITSLEDYQAFAKAVQTAGEANVLDYKGSLTGVPAIRYESLEATLRAVTEREETFSLWNRLTRRPVTSSITEFSTMTNLGGDFAETYHGELSDIRAGRTEYQRDIVKIKYLMQRAEVSMVAMQQATIEDVKAQENTSATTRILRGLEWGLYSGDETIVPEQFDGIEAQLTKKRPQNIIDMKGSSDTSDLYQVMRKSFADVTTPFGGFGKITDAYLSPNVQTDLDQYLDPAYRVALNSGDIEYGSPVTAVKTTFGNIKFNNSVWIPEGDLDYISSPIAARQRGQASSGAPDAPTLAAVGAAGVAGVSQFVTGREGTYYYGVACLNEKGEGVLSTITAATVAVDGKVTLTITPPAVPNMTGFAIYRSIQDPATVPTANDLRLIKRIPVPDLATPADNVVFEDNNLDIPGASKIFLFDLDAQSINWEQLLPMQQFPLYPTSRATMPWAVLLFGALKLGYPQRHFLLKNYIPKSSTWQPHTV